MAAVFRASGFTYALLLAAGLVLSGCANNQNDPNSQLGPDGKGPITPGTSRDFSVNVGDLVYFSSDSSDLTPEAQQTLQKQSQWLRQYPQFTITIEATRTSAVRANTTSRWVRGAPPPCATSWLRTAWARIASGRSPTARSGRWRSATTFRAGRRIGAHRRSSTVASRRSGGPTDQRTSQGRPHPGALFARLP